MAERWCKVCTGWHDLDRPWPDNCRAERELKRGDFATPMIISDTMAPVQGMVDGKIYDSKHRLRATYQPSGNTDGKEYNELGNDPLRLKPRERPKPDRKKIRDAIERARVMHSYGARPERIAPKT